MKQASESQSRRKLYKVKRARINGRGESQPVISEHRFLDRAEKAAGKLERSTGQPHIVVNAEGRYCG
jgi:hypothetical protein